MQNIHVKIPAIPAGGYDITIGSGVCSLAWGQIAEQFPGKKRFVVTDRNVVDAGHLKTLLDLETPPTYISDPPGEVSKNIACVTEIIEAMEKAAFGRDSCVVALGGGTVGDMAGFAAAIFKRGVPVIQIPTTSVSQADSAIGGKTGVDSTVSKNAYGAFWNPAGVYIDPDLLSTMDRKQYNAGLVESIKHALIADEDYFKYLQNNIDSILEFDTVVLSEVALRNCRTKSAVVEEDPIEKGMRKILNYGHTIGHAVESASNFEILHGQAVAIGILGASLIEQNLGLGDNARSSAIQAIFDKLEIDLKIPRQIKKSQIIELIKHDKKAVNAEPLFVLLEKTGAALCKDGNWAHPISADIVEKAIDSLY